MLYKASSYLAHAFPSAPRASCAIKAFRVQPKQLVFHSTNRQARCMSAQIGLPPSNSLKGSLSLSQNRLSAPLPHLPISVTSRHASSTSTTPTADTTENPSSSPEPQPLTWDGYLSLRQKRRYYNVIASSVTAVGTFTGGASFLLSQDLDKLSGLMFGLDPFITMGGLSFAFGAVGWLLGPFAGGFVFRLIHRRVAKSMEVVC